MVKKTDILANRLRAYFYSGWAFLIPYLAVYLLYYVTNWPVNPVISNQRLEAGGSQMYATWVPCMLHVYWALHAIHAILASVALWSWWASCHSKYQEQSTKCQNALHASSLWSLAIRLAPWALLALLFYIPGVYLEWPSDPWEHLRRINEWRILDTVGAHSSWMKSAYFIPYSLLSWCIGLRQLFWLDFYYTGICLLLCWQYYRFSRACGLGERSSIVFVIIQALLFGNNIFSFYRYYGISSSIYAQLGAIALTRIFLEWAARETMLDPLRLKSLDEARQCVDGEPRGLRQAARPERSEGVSERVPAGRDDNNTQSLLPIAHDPSAQKALPLAPGFCDLRSLLWLLAPCSLLLALTALNHPQGIGIAGLGITAIIVWRLIEWKRNALWWLIGGTLIINALFLWLYPRPAIIETYRTQGWLNAWYGFNILDLTSPACDRMMQVVGVFGLVNLVAALFLLYHNRVIAWLTTTPFLILMVPGTSIPFASHLAQHGDEINIITSQRMYFAITIGMALIYVGRTYIRESPVEWLEGKRRNINILAVTIISLILAGLMVVPSSSSTYNKVWHAITTFPNDLRLKDILAKYDVIKDSQRKVREPRIVTTQIGTALLTYTTDLIGTGRYRTIGAPPITASYAALDFLGFDPKANVLQLERSSPGKHKLSPSKNLNLIADPETCNPTAWVTLGGHSPEFVNKVQDSTTASTAIQNPTGIQSNPFTSELIPIQKTKSYRLEMKVRQIQNTKGTVFLAVAWFDVHGNFLASNSPPPLGTGNLRGWINGTYSYFGLVDQPAPTSWTRFGISFGLGEHAGIPPNASFMKVGALLNYNSAPSAIIQLTDLRLLETPSPAINLAIPTSTSTFSPTSQAAQLANHWPGQQVMIDRAGTKEIQAAALSIPSTSPR